MHFDPSKIEVIRNTPTQASQNEIRGFLGLFRYYCRFLRPFANISAPFHAVTSRKNEFHWILEMQISFDALKDAMTTTPVLAYPNFDRPFVVETDASSIALGAVLSQRDED